MSLSSMSVLSIKGPNCAKNALNDSLVADIGIPPTKHLAVLAFSARGIARLGSICGFDNGLSVRSRCYATPCQARTIFPSRKCSFTITEFTDLGSSNVRKAKPLDRPVFRSRMIVQWLTLPNCEKYCLRPSYESTQIVNGRRY